MMLFLLSTSLLLVTYLNVSKSIPLNSDEEVGFSLNTKIWHKISEDHSNKITSSNYITKGFPSLRYNLMMKLLANEVNQILKKINYSESVDTSEIIAVVLLLVIIIVISILFSRKIVNMESEK